MKKKILIVCMIILVIIGIIILICNFKLTSNKTDQTKTKDNYQEKEIKEIEEEEKLTEEKKEEIQKVQEVTGVTGDPNLYEMQDGYNDEKIAIVKSSVKYKVAFSGMIKKVKPDINEIDNTIKENHPKKAGIWIEEGSRQNFLHMLEEKTNSKYKIDENGYLAIENKEKQNENDQKIEKIITGNKLYIISISSMYYMVDNITGEILDYNFEDIDEYQTYEYINDNDKMIIFITENKNNVLSEEEIIDSVLQLLYMQ